MADFPEDAKAIRRRAQVRDAVRRQRLRAGRRHHLRHHEQPDNQDPAWQEQLAYGRAFEAEWVRRWTEIHRTGKDPNPGGIPPGWEHETRWAEHGDDYRPLGQPPEEGAERR
jgi:hypothetical protein